MADEPSTAPAAVTQLVLRAADGVELRAEHTLPQPPSAPRAAASIAHPHPRYGGTMHDAVVMTVERALVALGVATVRFAFRGTGGSGGTHDGGPGEREDVLAALAHAASLAPGAPLFASGYSFGAEVTLACSHPELAAWVVVAPPLRMFDDYPAATDLRPKHILAGVHDPYCSAELARAATAGWVDTTVHPVEMADHFFHGAHARLAEQVTSIVQSLLFAGD